MVARRLMVLVVAVWAFAGSGCALQNLKESNRRLRESNDRLIAENNRLEADLERLQRDLTDSRFVATTSTVARDVPPQQPIATTPLIDDDLLPSVPDEVEVDRTSDGVRLRLPDRVFFAPGKAELTSRGKNILRRVAQVISSRYPGHVVRVEGHTDDTPTRKVRKLYPTNWELSTARSCRVVRYLVDHGDVSPRSIFAAGFSYYRPLEHGRSSKARSRNRRVEITILDRAI